MKTLLLPLCLILACCDKPAPVAESKPEIPWEDQVQPSGFTEREIQAKIAAWRLKTEIEEVMAKAAEDAKAKRIMEVKAREAEHEPAPQAAYSERLSFHGAENERAARAAESDRWYREQIAERDARNADAETRLRHDELMEELRSLRVKGRE
jgi:hypothetical protein